MFASNGTVTVCVSKIFLQKSTLDIYAVPTLLDQFAPLAVPLCHFFL